MLLVAALVVGVLLQRQGPTEVEQRDEVLSVSRRFAIALATYDYRDLDRTLERVKGLSTGAFLDQYETTFASPELRQLIEESESVATAEVVTEPLLAELEGDRGKALVIVRQRVESKEQEEPVEQLQRMDVTLVETRNGWRVSDVVVV